MEKNSTGSANVLSRLDRLERQNRWLNAAAAVVLMLIMGLTFMAAAPTDVHKEIKAHKFTVIDEDGNDVGRLSQKGLTIRRHSDNAGFALNTREEGVWFEMSTPEVTVSIDPTATRSFSVKDNKSGEILWAAP